MRPTSRPTTRQPHSGGLVPLAVSQGADRSRHLPGGGSVPGAPAAASDQERRDRARTRDRSPLVDMLLPAVDRHGYMAELDIPAEFAAAAGLSAWYPLLSVKAESEGQELSLNGCKIEALPADVDGTTGFDPWGTQAGSGAAIIVGRNLPIKTGQWTAAPCYFPAMETVAPGLRTPTPPPEYIEAWSLPPGKFTDATPSVLYAVRDYGPRGIRVPRSARVDVALVIRGGQIVTASNEGDGKIRGRIHVQLSFARTVSLDDYEV